MKDKNIVKLGNKLLKQACIKFRQLRELDDQLGGDQQQKFVGHLMINYKLTKAKRLLDGEEDYTWEEYDKLKAIVEEIEEIATTRVLRKHISMMDPKDLNIEIPQETQTGEEKISEL